MQQHSPQQMARERRRTRRLDGPRAPANPTGLKCPGSVKVMKIPPSLTEIVKKLKEWNQKEAAWVLSLLLPLRTYKYKCGKAEGDALKCLDHLEKFSKGTAETPFKHSQAKTLCTEAYKWFRREKDYWVSPSMHMTFTLCPSYSCDCTKSLTCSHILR